MAIGYHIGWCLYRTFPSRQKAPLAGAGLGLGCSSSSSCAHLSVASVPVSSTDEFVGSKRERDTSVFATCLDVPVAATG